MLTTGPHPGDHLDTITNILPDATENTPKSVHNAFGLLPIRTAYNAFHESGAFSSNEYMEINNHFQGIQRLRDGQHFVISGGSDKDKKANLLICKAEKYGLIPNSAQKMYGFDRLEGAIGSNIINRGETPDEDTLVSIYHLNEDPEFWHAGGMDVCGDILAVPLENSKKKKAKIRFYDLSDPSDPKRLNGEIKIDGNSGGAALTRRKDGRFLCASWTDSDDGPDRFDFYLAKNPNDLTSWNKGITFVYEALAPEDKEDPKFQAINFIRQEDGRLFIIGTENSGKLAPVISGTDKAYLYEVIEYNDAKGRLRYHLIKVNQRSYEGGGAFSNFGAATGAYVNSQGDLALYSAHHWRSGGTIKIGEYWPVLEPNHRKISYKRDLIIELYEHDHFNGKALRIFGERFSKIRDFGKVRVEGSDFNDKISSLRMVLPEGFRFAIYSDKKFEGAMTAFEGNGFYQQWTKLGMRNDDFSSCRVEEI